MILVVNTAEETLQMVLAENGRLVEANETHCPGRMNEVMAPAVTELLKRHGNTLTAVACVRGPGSFTGVRMGLAFATGIALGRKIPMAGIDYLPALATAVRVPDAAEIHVVTHSRSKQVYHQSFQPSGDPGPGGLPALPAPMGPPLDLEIPAALDILRERAGCSRIVVLGSGVRRHHDHFSEFAGATILPVVDPTPEALLAHARAAAFDGPPVDALYLRGSDAEENLARIAELRGLTKEEAQARLDEARKS